MFKMRNRGRDIKRNNFRGSEVLRVWINRCKILYIVWINNKVLLYSTGNYIQYHVINHNGKKYEKNIYMYN